VQEGNQEEVLWDGSEQSGEGVSSSEYESKTEQ
jgi:hypothetical protein